MGIRFIGLLGIVFAMAAAGCGGGSAKVTGKVTAGGETVDGGSLVFQPLEGDTKPAAATITPEGAYELKTAGDEGIFVGDYRVLYTPPEAAEEEGGGPGQPSKWRNWKAPEKPVTVVSGDNDIPIELEKK